MTLNFPSHFARWNPAPWTPVPVCPHLAMGQKPNRTPSEHPNPTTQIRSKWDPKTVLTTTAIFSVPFSIARLQPDLPEPHLADHHHLSGGGVIARRWPFQLFGLGWFPSFSRKLVPHVLRNLFLHVPLGFPIFSFIPC